MPRSLVDMRRRRLEANVLLIKALGRRVGRFEIASVLERVFQSKLLFRGTPMTNEQNFISAEPFDGNLYISSRTWEWVPKAFIVQADISERAEEYTREL